MASLSAHFRFGVSAVQAIFTAESASFARTSTIANRESPSGLRMIAFVRVSIHQSRGPTKVAPSSVLSGVSAASCSRFPCLIVAAAPEDDSAAVPLACMESRDNERGMTPRVRIVINVTLRQNPGKAFQGFYQTFRLTYIA